MNEAEILQDVRILLGFDRADDGEDEKLKRIITSVKGRLKLLLGGVEPPAEMQHIVTDVSLVRFNRIGSEGVGNHSVGGESMTFQDSDFAGYMSEIRAYLEYQGKGTKGGLRFL